MKPLVFPQDVRHMKVNPLHGGIADVKDCREVRRIGALRITRLDKHLPILAPEIEQVGVGQKLVPFDPAFDGCRRESGDDIFWQREITLAIELQDAVRSSRPMKALTGIRILSHGKKKVV